MVEQQKRRLEHLMSELVDDLDRSHLRKMQGDMHRCAARCCDNTSYSLDKTHACIENCSTPLNNANNYVQSELTHLQNRLQRCVMQCNDEIREIMEINPTQQQADRYTAKFEDCAVKCVDKHVDSMPKLLQTMKSVLMKGPPTSSVPS
ncbi:protein FAM136A-like [Arctopsyche grandis]|uniref:protein FAM136A-like n=1 Tax=Arctopsyche grandis TaxID=121162 RepID=UPI00406DA1C9